jgi:hypothetical protein
MEAALVSRRHCVAERVAQQRQRTSAALVPLAAHHCQAVTSISRVVPRSIGDSGVTVSIGEPSA